MRKTPIDGNGFVRGTIIIVSEMLSYFVSDSFLKNEFFVLRNLQNLPPKETDHFTTCDVSPKTSVKCRVKGRRDRSQGEQWEDQELDRRMCCNYIKITHIHVTHTPDYSSVRAPRNLCSKTKNNDHQSLPPHPLYQNWKVVIDSFRLPFICLNLYWWHLRHDLPPIPRHTTSRLSQFPNIGFKK